MRTESLVSIFHLVGKPTRTGQIDYKPYTLDFEMLKCMKLKKTFLKNDLIGLLHHYKKSGDLIDLKVPWPTKKCRTSTREDKLIKCLGHFLRENITS